ncbi:hypothetical protein EMCG_09475 [[Emmonsia] crescens]|uniref:G-protein coupled receptors family 2 profile 2 domain-containing protein n=1 Tax=[Emmonsia] crescens TaxID=73230 RepID=A0A0G2J9V1_9EURO|nr:hypothetical protein EMCG_09475 [Emmonsia crescens UAMH 3008]
MSSSVPTALSPRQLHAMESSARAMSAVSISASFLVIASFLWGKLFQTPVNRLMFYATWGNVLANIGTMIGRSGITRGDDSGICRCQAFLLQWFLPTNALWIFCMALNVYLTSSHRFRSSELKRLEWLYFIICYLIPLVPALTFLFVQTKANGPVYGNAVLWCWIRPEWMAFRFVFFYGPIWLIIIITISILLYEGIEVISKQKKIKKLSTETINDFSGKYQQWLRRGTAAGTIGIPPVTNITIGALSNEHANAATCERPPSSEDAQPFGERATSAREATPSTTMAFGTGQPLSETPNKIPGNARSNINLEQSPKRSSLTLIPVPTSSTIVTSQDESPNDQQQGTPVLSGTVDFEANDLGLDGLENRSSLRSVHTANRPERTYGGILLVHTQPSNLSQNRSLSSGHSTLRHHTVERHDAAYMYMKRVALFFLSLFLTWTPSTINRIHHLCRPHEPVFGLALAASSFLSLQGFWNLIVYISTSFDAIKTLYAACRTKWQSPSEV